MFEASQFRLGCAQRRLPTPYRGYLWGESSEAWCERLRTDLISARLLNEQRVAEFFEFHRAVLQRVTIQIDFDYGSLAEAPANERLGKRVFDMLLQRAAQRSRAVAAIRAGLFHHPPL